MDKTTRLILLENDNACDDPKASLAEVDFMFIGELAEKVGLNPKTIRYYEKAGLLEPPRHGKFRTYMKEDAQKLNFVLKLRNLGVSIANIKSLADVKQNKRVRATAMLLEHVEDLRQKSILIEKQLQESIGILQELSKTDFATENNSNG
jgi:DNA-binding transcriptional MerR regulator